MAARILAVACCVLLLPHRALGQHQLARDAARLVADLQFHLRSACVFLPYDTPPSRPPVYEERLAAEIKKLLPSYASLYLESLEMMSEGKEFQHCITTSPLQVLFPRRNVNTTIMKKLSASYRWKSSVWLVFVAAAQEDQQQQVGDDVLRPVCGLEARLVLVATMTRGQVSQLSDVSCPRGGNLTRTLLDRSSFPAELEGAATNPLKGARLRVAVLEVPRISYLYDNNTRVGGIFGQVWEAFGRDLNFTSEYVAVEGSAYGEQQADGSWDGVVGMVKRREVDVGLAPLTMTRSRAEAVDFLVPLLMSNYMIFIRKPSATQINWKSFMKPFSWELWLTVAVLVVVVGVANTAAHVLIRQHVGLRDEEYVPPADNLFYAFTILYCYQGLDKLPNSLSCRTVYTLTFLTAVVLSEAYSGKLISFIAVKKTYLPFTSLQGIYEDGTFKFGVVTSTAEADLFKNSKEPTLRSVYEKLMAPDPRNYVEDEQRGLQRACDTDYAFLSSYEETASFVPQVSCAIVTLPEVFFKSALAVALPKGGPYIAVLNAKMTAAKTAGVVTRLYKKAWRHVEDLPSAETQPVEFSNVVPLLNILLAGVAASLLLLVAELLLLPAVRPGRSSCGAELHQVCPSAPTVPVLRGFTLLRRHSF